jgi:hypothetical protein
MPKPPKTDLIESTAPREAQRVIQQPDRDLPQRVRDEHLERLEQLQRAMAELQRQLQAQQELLSIVARNQAVLAEQLYRTGYETVGKVNQLLEVERRVGSGTNWAPLAKPREDHQLELPPAQPGWYPSL